VRWGRPLLRARWKLFQLPLIQCPEALKDQQNALPGRNPSRLKKHGCRAEAGKRRLYQLKTHGSVRSSQ